MTINEEIRTAAVSLVEILDLEISGERDGGGEWVDPDTVEQHLREMQRALTKAVILKSGGAAA